MAFFLPLPLPFQGMEQRESVFSLGQDLDYQWGVVTCRTLSAPLRPEVGREMQLSRKLLSCFFLINLPSSHPPTGLFVLDEDEGWGQPH